MTRAEIMRLKPSRIVIVGGTTSVSVSQQKGVAKLAKSVVRLSGTDRYATARLVDESAFTGQVGTVYVVTGNNWQDALTAESGAVAHRQPLIVVNGSAADLDAGTRALLAKYEPNGFTIIGSTSSVSSGIESDLGSIAPTRRISDQDVFSTAIWTADDAFASAQGMYVVSSSNPADALAAPELAGRSDLPVVYVDTNCVPQEVDETWSGREVGFIGLVGGGTLGPGVADLQEC